MGSAYNPLCSQPTDIPRPFLAEALPQLNTSTWQVFPDGRMETTYRLRPDLVWHDDTPLAADDFVFAWRVYTDRGLTGFGPTPQNLMEEVSAPDPRTLVIRWRQPYAEADSLGGGVNGFSPLPRHILQAAHEQGASEAFLAHPYWSREFLGLGPYRLTEWEPGAFVLGSAFERYALGKPKIERVRLTWQGDANTAVASLLGGGAHLVVDDTIRFPQAVTLQREWVTRGTGVVLLTPSQLSYLQVQLRPDLANPTAMLDVRVRRAIAHAIDKQAFSDGLMEGQALTADSIVRPGVHYFDRAQEAVAKYPFDLRRTEQLLGEAGISRGADGFYRAPGGDALRIELWTLAGGQKEAELAIMTDSLRRTGADASGFVIPAAQAQDRQVRASFPALTMTTSGTGEGLVIRNHRTIEIPGPQNNWTGQARSSRSTRTLTSCLMSATMILSGPANCRALPQGAPTCEEPEAPTAGYRCRPH